MSLISNEMYDWLNLQANSLRQEYIKAKPFPHLVFSSIFDPKKIEHIADNFPQPIDGKWWKYENVLEKKLARNDIYNLHYTIREFIHELMENRFVSLLEKFTGIEGLIVDHTLNGGGLHQIVRGGKLDIHADYNYHPITKLDRRLNVLVYLNKDWKPGWNGSLELWDSEMKECVKSIPPLINSMVIFGTTDNAYHGHPEPLLCPYDQSRKSVALYYYSNGRPIEERTLPHSTVFKRRPKDPLSNEIEELRKNRAQKRVGDKTT